MYMYKYMYMHMHMYTCMYMYMHMYVYIVRTIACNAVCNTEYNIAHTFDLFMWLHAKVPVVPLCKRHVQRSAFTWGAVLVVVIVDHVDLVQQVAV